MVKEDQEVGQVTGRVYGQYISAYGVLSAVLLILFWSGEQVGRVGAVGVGVPRVPASLGYGGGGAAVSTAASACCRPGPDCSLALLPLSPACRLPSCLAPQTLRILTSWYLSKWSGAEVMARYTGAPVDRIYYIGGYLGFALGEGAVGVRWCGVEARSSLEWSGGYQG